MKNRSFKEMIPNILTGSRIFGTIPVLILLCCVGSSPTVQLVTFLLIVVLSLTDCLDGNLARRFNCVSDFGKNFDPLADKWFAVLYIPMVHLGMIHFLPVALLLIRDITVTDLRAQAAKQGKVIAAHLSGKIKTLVSFPLLCLMIAAVPVENGYLSLFQPLGPYLYWIGGVLLSILSIWSGIDYYLKFE